MTAEGCAHAGTGTATNTSQPALLHRVTWTSPNRLIIIISAHHSHQSRCFLRVVVSTVRTPLFQGSFPTNAASVVVAGPRRCDRCNRRAGSGDCAAAAIRLRQRDPGADGSTGSAAQSQSAGPGGRQIGASGVEGADFPPTSSLNEDRTPLSALLLYSQAWEAGDWLGTAEALDTHIRTANTASWLRVPHPPTPSTRMAGGAADAALNDT